MTNSCRKIKARKGMHLHVECFLDQEWLSVEMCLFRSVVTLSDSVLRSNMIPLH